MTAAATNISAFRRSRLVIANLLLLLIVIAHSAWRDIHLERDYYATDLRNRVVGARLQEDGKLPYFYHWENKGEMRYADPFSRGASGANSITASPFFHELMMPVCDFQQVQLARFWLVFSWLLLAGMTALALRLTQNNGNKLLVINLAALFTLTEGWKMHIYAGQLYLFVAFLMTLLVWFLLRGKKTGWLPGGLVAAVLILCRPIALVTALPFLPLLKTYRLQVIATGVFLSAYALFAYATPFESALWADYRKALAAHVAYHQAGPFYLRAAERADRKLDTVEGVKLNLEHQQPSGNGPVFWSENGNIFRLYQLVLHRKMPLWLLNAALLSSLLFLEIAWIRRCRSGSPPAWHLPVLAWTFYMMVEMFSPVHRNQYNTVEWLPMLFTVAAFIDLRRWSPAIVLIALGLILNISNISWLLMRHTIGEFCWLAAGISVLLPETKKEAI